MIHRRSLLVLSAIACSSFAGCVGVSRVASLPPDAGSLVTYDASIDEVGAAVPDALEAVDQRGVQLSRPNDSTFVSLSEKRASFSSWGSVTRTRTSARSDGGSDVRVATRSRYIFDPWPSTRISLFVVREMDRVMGPERIRLAAGDRVRALDPRGLRVEGSVMLGASGGLVVESGSVPVPLESLAQVEVWRGTYGRGATGAGVGATLGLVAWTVALGVCLDSGSNDPNDFCNSSTINWAPAIGAVLGALLGSAVRTSVWSRAGSR